MRIVCQVTTPEFDSAGRTHSDGHVMNHRDDLADMFEYLSNCYTNLKPGMSILIELEEDWEL